MAIYKRDGDVIQQLPQRGVYRQQTLRKFGFNSAVGMSTEDIWSPGGTYGGWLTAASAVRIKAGGNAADTAAGAGARKIIVQGLDANFMSIQEEIATNGDSASSPTTQSFIRVYRAWVEDVGAYGAAATGDITIETTGGTTVAVIESDAGQTEMSMYCIEALWVGILTRFTVTVESSNAANVRMYQRPGADVASAPFRAKRIVHREVDFTGSLVLEFDGNIVFEEKTDLWVEAERTGGGDAEVTVSYNLSLFRT